MGHPTPEQDMQLAQQALAQGDLGHALHHVGGALSADPSEPQRLAMLDGILRRADDPLRLTALPDEPSFIDVANRAYAFALKSQWMQAYSLLAQVVATRPDIAYLGWAVSWAQTPGALQALSPDKIFPEVLAHLIRGLPNPCPPDDPARKNVEHARTLAAVMREVHPRVGAIFYFGSAIARRLGLHDEAIHLGKQAVTVDPSYLTAIGYACALRDAQRIDEAIAAFKDALVHDPQDIAVWLDVGDLELKQHRWNDAAAAYSKALEREPQHDWAVPSLHYARYRATNDPQALAALQQMRASNHRASDLLEELVPKAIDYVTALPPPRDSSYVAIRRALDAARQSQSTPSRMAAALPLIESPSVVTGFRLATAHLQPPPGLDLGVQQIQSPDPRVPKGHVDFILWAWDGTNPRPNVPLPDARVIQPICEIAASAYDLDQWASRAAPVGAQMGPHWVPQITCLMVHGAPPPPNMDAFEWVQRVQIASALVLAFVDQGWEGSARKRALQSLALGPVDWTTNAAILALSRLAKLDPAIRHDVEQLFGFLRQSIGPFACYEYPLVCAWLDLGGHAPQFQQELVQWRDRTRGTSP